MHFALMDDEFVLIVANASNNYLALFNITKKNKSRSLGFIPWLDQTAVEFIPQAKEIVVAKLQGASSFQTLIKNT